MRVPAHGSFSSLPAHRSVSNSSTSNDRVFPSLYAIIRGRSILSTSFADPLLSICIMDSALPLDVGSLLTLIQVSELFALGPMTVDSSTNLPILHSCNLVLSRDCLSSSRSLLCHTVVVRQKSMTLIIRTDVCS